MTWHDKNYSWAIHVDSDKLGIIWPDDQSQTTPTDYPQLRGEKQ